MPSDPLKDYPHLEFRRCWRLSDETLLNLGRSTAYIESLSKVPIDPQLQEGLRTVAFQRGAQATTAIEGNTLTDDELKALIEGRELPKSREYQAREVQNALEAMSHYWHKVIAEKRCDPISPQLLKDMNRLIGKDLGKLYDGVPGRFRNDRRHVGRYLAPPPESVPGLVDQFCDWLRKEFGFHTGQQLMHDAIIQAIVAHIFFEWIHPFADGNGRTGRLVEFYILLRAGFPDIAAHVLANHYNASRSEYTANFDEARKKRDLSGFLEYAIQGLVDGLSETLDKVREELFALTWEAVIYRRFAEYTDYRKRLVFKRRRALALAMPRRQVFSYADLLSNAGLGKYLAEYMGKDQRTLKSDLAKLQELGLVKEVERDKYRASTDQLLATHIAPRLQR